MRYNLNVSGRQYRLIRASIVNFQRSLTISEQGDFDELIDELDDCYLKLTLQQKEQLKIKVNSKWGKKK
tara:strand:- start:776 stop:982 length:207 start_codon:yes stop_codon:yes gene_type:complete